jgi:hypothetical protein
MHEFWGGRGVDVIELKMCVLIFSTVFLCNVTRPKRDIIINVLYIVLRVKYHYSCQIVTKLEFSGQIFEQ